MNCQASQACGQIRTGGQSSCGRAVLMDHPVGAIHSNDVSIYSCALGWHMANTPKRFVIKAQDYSWLKPYLEKPRPGNDCHAAAGL